MHRFLDIRFDIGLILITIGSILVITGIVTVEPTRVILCNLNINIVWGAILAIVGGLFMWVHANHSEEYGS